MNMRVYLNMYMFVYICLVQQGNALDVFFSFPAFGSGQLDTKNSDPFLKNMFPTNMFSYVSSQRMLSVSRQRFSYVSDCSCNVPKRRSSGVTTSLSSMLDERLDSLKAMCSSRASTNRVDAPWTMVGKCERLNVPSTCPVRFQWVSRFPLHHSGRIPFLKTQCFFHVSSKRVFCFNKNVFRSSANVFSALPVDLLFYISRSSANMCASVSSLHCVCVSSCATCRSARHGNEKQTNSWKR